MVKLQIQRMNITLLKWCEIPQRCRYMYLFKRPDFDRSGGKYRSKYRRKRRSSSSSSEAETGNGKSTAAEPPPPPPVKRYYGRKRTETDEEKLTEDEDGPATE